MNSKEPVITTNICVDEEYVWFVHRKYDALLRFNLITKELDYIITLPKIDDWQTDGYGFSKIVKNRNNIILIPNQNSSLLVIDEKSLEYTLVEIDNKKYKYGLFRSAFLMEEGFFLIPSQYDFIAKYDMESGTVERVINWREKSREYTAESYISDFSIEGDRIALLVKPQNEIMVFSTTKRTIDIITPANHSCDFATIIMLNNRILAQGKEVGITEIDVNGNLRIISKEKEFKRELYLYKFGNEIMLDYLRENRIIICNEDLELEQEYNDAIVTDEEYVYFVFLDDMKYGDYKLYFNNATSELLLFNKSGINMIEQIDAIKEKEKMINGYLRKNSFVSENKSLNVRDFVKYLI